MRGCIRSLQFYFLHPAWYNVLLIFIINWWLSDEINKMKKESLDYYHQYCLFSCPILFFDSFHTSHAVHLVFFERGINNNSAINTKWYLSLFTNHFETILTIVINKIVSLFKVLPAQQAHSLSLDDFYNSDWDADGQQRALHAILVRLLFRCVLSSYAFGARPDSLCSRL